MRMARQSVVVLVVVLGVVLGVVLVVMGLRDRPLSPLNVTKPCTGDQWTVSTGDVPAA